jgi:hypothetical protein
VGTSCLVKLVSQGPSVIGPAFSLVLRFQVAYGQVRRYQSDDLIGWPCASPIWMI